MQGYAMLSTTAKRFGSGLIAAVLTLLLSACASPAISTPPPAQQCVAIPDRLISDIDLPLLTGPTERDALEWESRLVEAITQANDRLTEARNFQKRVN